MKIKTCAVVAMAMLVLGSTAPAADDDPPRTAWGRLVEGTKDVFRTPQKSPPRTTYSRPPEAARANYNQAEPKPVVKEKTNATAAKTASLFARKTRKPPRTVSEYMAHERP